MKRNTIPVSLTIVNFLFFETNAVLIFIIIFEKIKKKQQKYAIFNLCIKYKQ